MSGLMALGRKRKGEGGGGGGGGQGGNVRVTRVTWVVKIKQSASDCLGVSARIEIF